MRPGRFGYRAALAGVVLAVLGPASLLRAADPAPADDAAGREAAREASKEAAKAARDAAKTVRDAVKQRIATEEAGVPEPPEPPVPPDPAAAIRGIHIGKDETHRGDITAITPSATIEGMQDGDVYLWTRTARITGTVTGDVFFAGDRLDITGEVKKSVRAAGANVVVDGTVDGNLQAVGASLTLGSKAHVKGNVSAYTGQMSHSGVIDGTLKFAGGTLVLAGTVGEDAELTADTIQVEHGAQVGGDVAYSARNRIDDELKPIVGGNLSFDERPIKKKERHEALEQSVVPTRFGFGTWLAFLIASYLFGCAFVALFRNRETAVLDAIRKDALRSTGIGFVSVLVTFAVVLSAILLLTIPLVVLYLLAYAILWYLARVPVALWVGRTMLGWAKRSAGPYVALLVGLVALHLLFLVPVLGWIVHWVAMPLLGMGAMITSYIAFREAKRAAALAAAAQEAETPQAS